jgi:4'-phosphopantetheinyl transferase
MLKGVCSSTVVVPTPLYPDTPVTMPAPSHGTWIVDVSDYCRGLSHEHERVLDHLERERLARLVNPSAQDSFRAAHVAMRRLLAQHLNTDPASIVFTREPCARCAGAHGRPALQGFDSPHFSISRRDRYALLSISRNRVGVDVERVPSVRAARQVWSDLHPNEIRSIYDVPETRRAAVFASIWSRKEAYLKGIGVGLARPISADDLGPYSEPYQYRGWVIENVTIGTGHVGALATHRVQS